MYSDEKVFITGAAGMLGSSICRELINQGYSVKALVIPKTNLNVIANLDIEIVEGDILDRDFLIKEMADCQYVIHAAASTTMWPRRSETILKVNLNGTENIIKATEKLHLKRMVHIGTANSFGHGSKENPGDELTPEKFSKYRCDYIDSKLLAQKMLVEKYSQDGFPVIIINPTFMIGPFDSGPSSGKMILALLENKLPGYTNGGKNFICSFDAATAAVNALKIGKLGECYIVGNENLNFNEFLQKVCLVENKKFKLYKVPGFVVLSIGFKNSMLARITNKPPELSYTYARIGCVGQYYSSKKAQKELNLPRTPIEEGIKRCIDWFKINGYLK